MPGNPKQKCICCGKKLASTQLREHLTAYLEKLASTTAEDDTNLQSDGGNSNDGARDALGVEDNNGEGTLY